MPRDLDVQKLARLHERLLKTPHQDIAPFDATIFYDGRQYSCKLPAKLMAYARYKKGALLRFTVHLAGTGEPRITAEYVPAP
jgi:hypothetical protein